MKVQWLDRDLIANPLYLGLCLSEEAFHREMRRLAIPREKWPNWISMTHANATAHYFDHSKSRRRLAIICLRREKGISRIQIYGLLVHEAVHIWQWIKEDIGEDAPSKEFEAYSIQRLAMNLMSAYG
jgi:hypothetical protein